MRFPLFIICFVFTLNSFAQKKGWDSTYYVKYKDRLIVSVFQSYKNYGMDISQLLTKDTLGQSKIAYVAEANLIYGIELNYDKFNLSIGFKNPSTQIKQKGDTKYRNYALNIGGNRWILENSYRSYKGFYNKNTSLYDTSFRTTGIYDQYPNLYSEAYKTKFLFFTNANKFSFKSGYSCSYKQLKTAFSFVLSANIYYNRLNSDSSFFPHPIRGYYDTHQSLHGLNVFAVSVYGGGSLNLVLWKAFFMNFTLIIGPEEQWRNYKYLDANSPDRTLFYTSISGDFRGSIGLNFKKFFVLLSATSDFSWYNASQVTYLSKYGSVNFSLGYRFKMKPSKGYQKFQQSKLYRRF
ncbi:MAG: hypothetical protein K0S53_940 [Bacteroidetes bacterium]|jgi:hypothetical protein|nr:hypothetical protein [Bacteroidota bacterium]MDF2450649.1 hypothetical protein [Bacteroidota bacterium]